jgi:hypothetical protein
VAFVRRKIMSLDHHHAMTTDTLFRNGTGFYGRDGIVCRETTHSKPHIELKIAGHDVIYTRFNDGRIAEVLMEGEHSTAARLVTALLRHGVEIETVRNSIPGGTSIATVLDHLMAISGGPRSAAYRWLEKCGRRQTLNRRHTTQMWKHQAEADEGRPVSLAEFHEAAIELGFRLKMIRGTPNAWINIANPKATRRAYRR